MNTTSIYGDTISPFSPDEIKQSTNFTCAVKSQQLILNMFGVDVSEQDLMNEAYSLNILSTNGTSMGDVGKLLELHGVGTQTFPNGNVATLMNELAQGHQVIVGVDSGELWQPYNEFFEDNAPDHALIVTGVDVSDPANVQVIVTDPGCGKCCTYPYEQFVNAWSDSGCYMVSTTEAPDIKQLDNLDNDLIDTLQDTAFDIISDNFTNLFEGGGIATLQDLIMHIMETPDPTPGTYDLDTIPDMNNNALVFDNGHPYDVNDIGAAMDTDTLC